MRIVVAMSGGVDSSVAAALLARRGTRSIGLSMQLYDQREGAARSSDPAARSTTCTMPGASPPASASPTTSSTSSSSSARRSCRTSSGVRRRPHADPLRALQRRPEVRDARRAGRRLRRDVRGHRALRTRRARRGIRALPPAPRRRPGKDQSYFLFSLTQAQLAHAIFPVGHLDKAGRARARARAGPAGRRQARQPRDLLRPRRRSRRVSSRTRPAPAARVSFATTTGRVVGRHAGSTGSPSASEGAGHRFPDPALRGRDRCGGEDGDRRAEGRARAAPADGVRRELDCGRADEGDEGGGADPPPPPAAAATPRAARGDRARVVFDEPQVAIAPGPGRRVLRRRRSDRRRLDRP
jgi:hypothetical protein